MTPLQILTVIYNKLAIDPNVQTYIDLATMQTSRNFYGVNYSLAIALLAAHTYFLSVERAGKSGVVTYQGAGRLLESTGGLGVIRNDLELSNFGMQLIRLRKASGIAATITAENIYTALLS
jgi:hypothetical protein